MKIHPTAILDEDVKLGQNIEIGAYSIIGKGVEVGNNTIIANHVEIAPYTIIGNNNRIFKGASLGGEPQDINFKTSDERKFQFLLEIGDFNIIREFVTIHHSTIEGQKTIVGNNNYLMAYSHIAHDCILHNHVILANYTALAGWVEVKDYAFLSGHTLVHQYVRVGEHAMIGGLCRINQDVPPYALVAQENGKLYGINWVGLKRRGWNDDKLLQLKKVYKTLFQNSYTLKTGMVKLEELKYLNSIPLVMDEIDIIVKFIKNSSRGTLKKK